MTPSIDEIRLDQIFHHLQRLEPLVIGGLRSEQFDARAFFDRLVEAAHAIVAGGRPLDALDDHDVALRRRVRLEQIAAGVETQVVIVCGDVAYELAAANAIVVIDQRNARRVDLFDRRHDAARIHRHEQDRVRLLDGDVLDLGKLLGQIVRPGRRVVRDRAGAHVLRRRLDAGAHQREVRVDLVLVEGGKALAGGARRSGRQRSAGRRRRSAQTTAEVARSVFFIASLLFRSDGGRNRPTGASKFTASAFCRRQRCCSAISAVSFAGRRDRSPYRSLRRAASTKRRLRP